jgi:catechol 2,3-dioxygenase-like lactoylglutathione lyase family enzyme
MTDMILHRGRLIDHVHLRAADLDAAKRFYRAILATLGVDVTIESDDAIGFDELWIDRADSGVSRVHLAFQAKDSAAVDRFYAAGLEAGGRDNGKPGERQYHPGYYACFLFDPDGNNVEAVYHGPAEFSAKSVEIKVKA